MSVLNFFFQETKQKKNYRIFDRLQQICKCLLGLYALRQRCATPLILILLQKKYSPYYSTFQHLKIKECNMDYFLSLIVKVKLEAHAT